MVSLDGKRVVLGKHETMDGLLDGSDRMAEVGRYRVEGLRQEAKTWDAANQRNSK